MKYRQLGKNGPTVSAIGLGAGSATTNFGERDDEVQIATVHRAIDFGVTLFDTADCYMTRRHEHIPGRALAGRRDRVVVCTKFGNIDNPDGSKAYNGKPEYVRSACEASLKQLGLETIDLYYLHRIDPDVPIEETVGAMAGLVKAGKVRWLGLSEAGPDSLKRASKIHPITALQTEYSLWARDVEDKILPACRELGIGFVAYSPLGRGLLTGNIRRIEDIAAHDVRRKQPRFRPGKFAKNLELDKPLADVAAKRGAPPPAATAEKTRPPRARTPAPNRRVPAPAISKKTGAPSAPSKPWQRRGAGRRRRSRRASLQRLRAAGRAPGSFGNCRAGSAA